jgi:hypothetical protein
MSVGLPVILLLVDEEVGHDLLSNASDRLSYRPSCRVVETKANLLVVTEGLCEKGADCSVSDNPLFPSGCDGRWIRYLR